MAALYDQHRAARSFGSGLRVSCHFMYVQHVMVMGLGWRRSMQALLRRTHLFSDTTWARMGRMADRMGNCYGIEWDFM